MQKLFSLYKGSEVLPMLMNNIEMAGADSLYASASIDKNANQLILKIVNASGKGQTKNIVLDGLKKAKSKLIITTMQSTDLEVVNSFVSPLAISPVETASSMNKNKLNISLAPYSFSIIRIDL